LKNLVQKYGDIYTFWIGWTPIIVISSVKIGKNAFSKYECADRMLPKVENYINSKLFGGVHSIFSLNFGEDLRFYRKISIEALRFIII
jgi:hypothetical protein